MAFGNFRARLMVSGRTSLDTADPWTITGTDLVIDTDALPVGSLPALSVTVTVADSEVPPETEFATITFFIGANSLPADFPNNNGLLTLTDAVRFGFGADEDYGASITQEVDDVTVSNTYTYRLSTASTSDNFSSLSIGTHTFSITASVLFGDTSSVKMGIGIEFD